MIMHRMQVNLVTAVCMLIMMTASYSWHCSALSWRSSSSSLSSPSSLLNMKPAHNFIAKPIITSIVTAISILNLNPIVHADDGSSMGSNDVVTVVRDEPIKQKLSAADVLKSDIDPKVDSLKDILFIIKLYPSYVESLDYASIRQSLRQDPVVELRKTCKKLSKYLPAAQITSFNKNYNDMIDKINELDVVSDMIDEMIVETR